MRFTPCLSSALWPGYMSRQVASDSNVAFNLQNAPADSDSIVTDERTVLIYCMMHITLTRTSSSHEFLMFFVPAHFFFLPFNLHFCFACTKACTVMKVSLFERPDTSRGRRDTPHSSSQVGSCPSFSFLKTSKQHQRVKRAQDQILHLSKERWWKKMSLKH
jgi:hypothetical protein